MFWRRNVRTQQVGCKNLRRRQSSRQRRAGTQLRFETLESRTLLSATTAVQSGDWDSPSTWSSGVPDETLRAIIPTATTVSLTGTEHVAQEIVVQGTLDVAESPGTTKTLTAAWIHVNSGGVFQIGTEADRYDANDFVVTLTGDDPTEVFTVEGAGTITDNNGFLMAAGGGRLQFFGEEKLTFTKLAATAEVGANQVLVEAAIDRNFDGDIDAADGSLNWEVGDQIVFASSSRDYADEEVRTINAIVDQGQSFLITLDAPLANRHYGHVETYGVAAELPGDFSGDGIVDAADYTVWRDNLGRAGEEILLGAGDRSGRVDQGDYDLWKQNYGQTGQAGANASTWDIDMRAEVAILNRNVRIQGLASHDTDNAFGDRARFNAGTGDGFGSHTMIMASAGQITIDSVQFDRMGQTARLGRYPIHWHLAGDRTGDILRGASITNSNNRGVTVHGTHNLLIQDVLLHDVHGHGFFMEDGVETGNQFLANIALGIHKVGRSDAVGNGMPDVNDPFIVDTHDFVAQNELRFLSSSAYWVTNPDNTWVGNISAGVDGTGFWFILPEFAIGLSAADPQYNNVNANETPLGLFDHNTSHSSHVGFNMDRGMDLESPVGATLLNNSFGRAYQPENASGQQVEPVFSNFTAYKHEVGVYQRGRYGQFDQNKYADNFTSTFITFSQRITDTLYVGHSRGNENLSEVVTGQSLYDGPNSMDGTHFAGFNRGSNAHVFRNHGGALRNTHVYVSNTSFEEDGTKEQLSISQRYGETYNASRDAFDFQAPTAIYDVDGTLTGHGGGGAGTVLLPDNDFITDNADTRPAGWDARISDDLYANFRIEFEGNDQSRLTLITPDGDSDTESQDNSHRTILKANNEIYTVIFPDGVSSVSDGFEILYRIQLGNTNPASITESSIIRFQGLTDVLRVLEMSNRFNGSQSTPTTQVASLSELENVSGPAYWVDGDDLVVKFVTAASEAIRYKFTPGSNTPIGSSIVLWEDTSPPDNVDGSAVTKIADPFGTGMGDIGRWVTNGQGTFHNINPDGPVLDVSGFDGFEYVFSFDYYVDSTQPLTDDRFYQSLHPTDVYGATNFIDIGEDTVSDSWTTVVTTGTIDTSSDTTVNPLIIVNHRGTTEPTASFYIDNIRFSINIPQPSSAVAAPIWSGFELHAHAFAGTGSFAGSLLRNDLLAQVVSAVETNSQAEAEQFPLTESHFVSYGELLNRNSSYFKLTSQSPQFEFTESSVAELFEEADGVDIWLNEKLLDELLG